MEIPLRLKFEQLRGMTKDQLLKLAKKEMKIPLPGQANKISKKFLIELLLRNLQGQLYLMSKGYIPDKITKNTLVFLGKGMSRKNEPCIPEPVILETPAKKIEFISKRKQDFLERQRQAIELYNQGVPKSEIIKQLDTSYPTLSRWLSGVTTPRRTDEEKENAIKLFEQGKKLTEIRDTLKIPQPTLYCWWRRWKKEKKTC